MEVKVISGKNNDGAMHDELHINGKEVLSAYPLYECPEDASLERDMTSCSEVETLMKRAYDAGKAGEPYKCEYEDEE